jgi:hypothetical protein
MTSYESAKWQVETIKEGCVEEQEMCVGILDDWNGRHPELDQEYVKHMKELKHLFGGCDLSEESWRFFAKDIAEGKFPLKKLPDHVRDLAQELYY